MIRILAAVALALQTVPGIAQSPLAPPRPPYAARGTVQVAFTPWDDAEGLIVKVIAAAKTQILVQAYSFTSRAIAGALISARNRGVEVQILADREQTFSAENSRISDLAAAGIPVALEVLYQSAHNKIMIIDSGTIDAAVVTGSYNWTFAAQNRNAENVIVFRRNSDLAGAFAENWRRHWTDALPYEQAKQP